MMLMRSRQTLRYDLAGHIIYIDSFYISVDLLLINIIVGFS